MAYIYAIPPIPKYTVNTFEQLVGRQIIKVLRLDTGEVFPSPAISLAVYLMLEQTSGLLISFGFHKETITMNYTTLEDLQEEYGTEWGESSLHELEPPDRMNQLVGQAIQSIKVGQLNKADKFVGNDFVVSDNDYTGVVIQTTNDCLVIYSTKEGGQILFDKDELPHTEQN